MTQNQPNRLDAIEATQAVHSQILNELALAHRELASFSTRQAERQQQTSDRHDEVLSRLENSANRHDEALTRLENSVNRQQETLDRHETTLARIERSIEALTTSTTETIQLVAQNSIAIREIWRYLRYEPRNGNGRGENE
ncbi:hypothetical protein [Fischerella thermalis]|uniref:Uncharacterized protein n=1 Tax=Fischerella thermalis CCMEE 5318 TaxID=2019666 RepID=A0A2N6LNX4_9CYAN|nr:hypothetical protein [Fischerella thermalis]PMB27374.1 hypothetical protein CEN46_01650 [Fischerella thermalis CCMEE 5318]